MRRQKGIKRKAAGVKTPEAPERRVKNVSRDFTRIFKLMASLEAEKTQLQEEKLRLNEQILALKNELGHYRRARPESKLRTADPDSQRISEAYVATEQQNGDLTKLYVASARLHSNLQRDSVLTAMREIICDLIGTNEMAIFELDAGRSALLLVESLGIDPASYGIIPLGKGFIGSVALTGEPHFRNAGSAPAAPTESQLTACIPMKLDGKVIGAIAIFRLLEQKSDLEAFDFKLFDFLTTHAAVALHSANVHAKLTAASEVMA